MSLSGNTILEMFKQETADQLVTLLILTFPGTATPIRVCNDSEDITSNGVLYQHFPFLLTLPQIDEGVPKARITLDNVGLDMIAAVRTVQPGDVPTVSCKIVLKASPNEIEQEPFTLDVVDVRVDAMVIEGNLGVPDESRNPVPHMRFNKAYFPGLG